MPAIKSNPISFAGPERLYLRALTGIARHVGVVVNGFAPGSLESSTAISKILVQYAGVLEEWSLSTAARMLTSVEKADANGWRKMAKEMSSGIREEIENAPTGEVLKRLMAENVKLIRSIPLEAAERVHKLTLEALSSGERRDRVVAEIMRTSEVTRNRAVLIAQTESARAQALFTMARAQHVGSTHFRWETVKDNRVRHSHKAMQGKTCEWANPPLLPDGTRALPGTQPRCRCFATPILPE